VRRRGKNFLTFKKARRIVRKLKLQSFQEWLGWQRPLNIPSNPDVTYRHLGWKGYDDWLGKKPHRKRSGTCTRRRGNAKNFLPFTKARIYVRKLELRSTVEWYAWCRFERPLTIPSNPHKYYKQWRGYSDWIGAGRKYKIWENRCGLQKND